MEIMDAVRAIVEGGAGSGHWGHRGRPGVRGGSLPGAGGAGGVAAHVGPMTAGGKHRATTGGVHRAYTSSFMAKYLQKKIAQGRYNTWDAANRKLREKFPGQPTSRYGRALQKAGLIQGAAPVPRPVQVVVRPVQPAPVTQAPVVHVPAGPAVTVNSHSGEQIVVDTQGVGLGGDRQPFTTGRIIQERRLRGGINRGTAVIDLEGDGSAVRKTAAGEERGLRRGIAGGTYYRREAGAYAVARILGLDHLVPETYVRNEGGVSSVQKFVEDSKPAASVGYHKTDEIMRNDVRQLTEAAFFDFVIGNQDRHNGNYMVNEDTKRFALIDNGLSMAKDGHYLRSEFIFNASQGGKKIPADLVTRVMNTETSIYAALKKVGIEDSALANMQKRIKVLKDLSQNGRENVSVRDAMEAYKAAVPAR